MFVKNVLLRCVAVLAVLQVIVSFVITAFREDAKPAVKQD
jgi:hypothetical protein